MRKISYDEFKKIKKEKYFALPAILGRKRLSKNIKRDISERRYLRKMDYLRYKKWIKEGELIELSPRKKIVTVTYF